MYMYVYVCTYVFDAECICSYDGVDDTVNCVDCGHCWYGGMARGWVHTVRHTIVGGSIWRCFEDFHVRMHTAA